ncbi:MAG: 16S rRNA (uracil(1498)-N(3))-methyltransferase [Burkholderiaceae bacterium]|jgi:16S rRNA (uracil1498-N3)-methyltransferase|nr:16S rRNA (uracil(1498)-N(3))-methyltransferase [Burkholderiaceae bacterium]
MFRIYVAQPLSSGAELALPAGAARHVQVLRAQPGHALVLFNGAGGQWSAVVTHMGRGQVRVRVGEHSAAERECQRAVHLAVGLMAADRMDWMVEKATELGAASFTPLVTERANLRLSGERAGRKLAHWQAVAVAACEQCGRNRVPQVHAPMALPAFLAQGHSAAAGQALALSLSAAALPMPAALAAMPLAADPVWLLSGPEGGLSLAEESAARAAGFVLVGLGPRVLRAETAPLAALALLCLDAGASAR